MMTMVSLARSWPSSSAACRVCDNASSSPSLQRRQSWPASRRPTPLSFIAVHGSRRQQQPTAARRRSSTAKPKRSNGREAAQQSKKETLDAPPANAEEEVEEGEDAENEDSSLDRAELQEKISKLLSNAQRSKQDGSSFRPRFSLGVDFGDVRTGVAVSRGFAPRPVEVVELQGPKLEARLLDIAAKELADEFIVGLPKSNTGLESHQCNKVRCFAGRLAVRAAYRGWRVYLYDEFGSSEDALDYMILMGSTKKGRRTQIDAYAAAMLLRSYFDNAGNHAELVVPKNLSVQQRLCKGYSISGFDDDDDDDGGEEFYEDNHKLQF